MKKKFLLITNLLCAFLSITAKQGCLSKSYALKQPFDPKEYHSVNCNCPCDYWAMRGLHTNRQDKCLTCGHAHNPGPNPYTPENLKNRRCTTVNGMICLQQFINAYRQ